MKYCLHFAGPPRIMHTIRCLLEYLVRKIEMGTIDLGILLSLSILQKFVNHVNHIQF